MLMNLINPDNINIEIVRDDEISKEIQELLDSDEKVSYSDEPNKIMELFFKSLLGIK